MSKIASGRIIYLMSLGAVTVAYANVSRLAATDLNFLLYPTQLVITALSGIRFHFVAPIGYLSEDSTVALVAECAGARFLCIALVVGINLCGATSAAFRSVRNLSLVLLGAFACTVLANGCRVLATLRAGILVPALEGLSRAALHELVGVATYFLFLVMYALLIRSVLRESSIG